MTVLLGPNGSGKSTVFDVFAFLAECFESGLRRAWREHPRVGALRTFITGWHLSYLSADSARGQPEAGPQERLTKSGENLANVVRRPV